MFIRPRLQGPLRPDSRTPPFKGTPQAVFAIEEAGPTTTEVVATIDYQLKGGPLGTLMDVAMARRQLGQGFTALLAGLKHHVETGETVDDTTGLELAAVSEG